MRRTFGCGFAALCSLRLGGESPFGFGVRGSAFAGEFSVDREYVFDKRRSYNADETSVSLSSAANFGSGLDSDLFGGNE